VVAGDGEEELVVEEVLDGDFFVGGRALDEAEIGFRGEDPGGDLVCIAAFDGELNAGVGAEECAEDAREQVLGDGGGGGDAEWSAGLSLEVGEGGECFLGESRRAWSRTRVPAGVRVTPEGVLSRRRRPSASSRRWTCWLTEGWLMRSSSAARRKLACSATARKTCRR
jgi:hypothetical protein